MVAHYTAARKRRHDDAYSPGNRAGLRPDRATIVYANKVREAFGDIPIVIGGLEASLRRFAHYDYWEDKVRRSILLDAQADLLTYGMGERATRQTGRSPGRRHTGSRDHRGERDLLSHQRPQRLRLSRCDGGLLRERSPGTSGPMRRPTWWSMTSTTPSGAGR